jgi:DNA-directed RNA polymerase subunit H (RpoH/RPB5)
MSGTLYRKYLNIQLFVNEYRKFVVVEPFLKRKQFKKTMQLEQYVRSKCRDPKTGKVVYIYLMKTDSKYIKATPNFKKLMDSLGAEPADVYIITKVPLSIYINKTLHRFINLKISNFMHKNFSIETTKGPHCSEHTILADDEVIKTCFQDLMIHPLSIPPIYITDPICVWIGAEIGQVIRIKSRSENSGEVIRYRIVSPKVGRIPVNKTPNITSLEKKKISEDEDEAEDEAEVEVDEYDDEVEVETKEDEDDGTDLYDIDEDLGEDLDSDVESDA